MVTDAGKSFLVNTVNDTAFPNLPPDAFIEMKCAVDNAGPHPKPGVRLPRGLRALQMHILDVHELTVEAVVTRDRALLRRAMMVDGRICSQASLTLSAVPWATRG